MGRETFAKYTGATLLPFSFPDHQEVTKKFLAELPNDVKSQAYVGIEIECENARPGKFEDTPLYQLFQHSWVLKEDGSLRNNGVEFVTRLGINASQAAKALYVLERAFDKWYPKIQANARTGVHIHLNFLDKTAAEVGCMTALYSLFEQSLFQFSGNRNKNIFCIPVRDSVNIVGPMLREIRKSNLCTADVWKRSRNSAKYLAFNLGALCTFGSIEFRHGEGTNRPTSIIPWLKTLTTLYDFAMAQDFESLLKRIRDLNTNSQYEALMKEALPPEFIQKVGSNAIVQDMIQGCTFIKEVLINTKEISTPSISLDVGRVRPRGGGFDIGFGLEHAPGGMPELDDDFDALPAFVGDYYRDRNAQGGWSLYRNQDGIRAYDLVAGMWQPVVGVAPAGDGGAPVRWDQVVAGRAVGRLVNPPPRPVPPVPRDGRRQARVRPRLR